MIEGGTGFGDNSPGNLVDTTNILFVATGAFVGMDEVISKRLQPAPAVKARIGFTNDGGDRSASTGQDTGEIPVSGVVPTAADLIDYGFIPELVGRLPLRCRYNELSESSLYSILSESAISPVKGFQKLFGMNGNWLAFTSNALKCIARQAYDEHMGARGLQEVVGKIVYPVLYELSETNGMHVLITTDTIMNGKPPVIKKLGSDGRQGAPAGTGRPGHAARKYNW